MSFWVPVIAFVAGLAILAPSVMRIFKKQESASGGCGGCNSCSGASNDKAKPFQVVQLRAKKQPGAGECR